MSGDKKVESTLVYICPHCGEAIAELSDRCPHCEQGLEGLPAFVYRPRRTLAVKVVAIAILALMVAASIAMVAMVFQSSVFQSSGAVRP